MIRTIELFPGAIVRLKNRKTILRVCDVHPETVWVEAGPAKWLHTHLLRMSEIAPIPITPEIVKKLGFRKERKSSNVWAYYKRGDMEIRFLDGKLSGIRWKGYQKSMKKAYVHNLQRLTLVETRARIDFSKLIK